MKLTRSAAIALSVTALAAAGAPLAAQAATTHAAAPQARPAATSVAVYNCGNKPLVTFLFPGDSIRSHNTETLVPPGVFRGEY